MPNPTHAEVTDFLHSIYPADLFTPNRTARTRPFVTLTYAQSLDGKIAGVGGAQIRLSGDESMALTHRLRELHDKILVGVGTMLSDDPQLSARIPTLLPLQQQPQPIILDSHLRTPPSCKLLLNYRKAIGRQPMIITSKTEDTNHESRRDSLVEAGALVVAGIKNHFGQFQLENAMEKFVKNELLMVEGGASVISSFLASGLVDLVVITIAPVFVGDGIGVISASVEIPRFKHVTSKLFGKDVVVILRPE